LRMRGSERIRARLQPCRPVWTFAGAARLGVRRLDAAFLAEHAWPADAAPLAKAVAALPHSKASPHRLAAYFRAGAVISTRITKVGGGISGRVDVGLAVHTPSVFNVETGVGFESALKLAPFEGRRAEVPDVHSQPVGQDLNQQGQVSLSWLGDPACLSGLFPCRF
jgi:hypothetical protein